MAWFSQGSFSRQTARLRKKRILQVEQLEQRLALATLPAGFAEVTVATGLTSATAMEIAPDGRLWVLEQSGDVEVFHNGSLTSFTALDIPAANISAVGERGLLGIAFDPSYNINSPAPDYVYLYYTSTSSPDPHNRISRFTVNNSNANQPTLGSEFIVMELDSLSTATNHNGSAIHFGPDGYLYAAVGDNAKSANSQTLANRHGKILRIDISGDDFTNPNIPGDAGQNYRIPTGNPTTIPGATGTATGYNRSIWAAGLRNPYTFSFQPGTGRMHINDVGAGTWEEINVGTAGANYGWPATEGDFNQASFPNYTRPFYAYSHGSGALQGFAITGGAFYNPSSPGLNQFPAQYQGDYFFADFVNDWINVIDIGSGAVSQFATGANGAVDLRVTGDGSIYYLARIEGVVRRVTYTAFESSHWQFDFGTATSPLAAGYTRVTASTAYSTALGYGWQSGTIKELERPNGPALTRDLNYTQRGVFLAHVPNGEYDVTLNLGDVGVPGQDQQGVFLEGVLVDTITTSSQQAIARTYRVNVSDGRLTLLLDDLGGSDLHVPIQGLSIVSRSAAANWQFDFGTATSPLAAGYTRVTASSAYSAALGYGWQSGTINELERPNGSALTRDLNYTQRGVFLAHVPNGEYDVTLNLGDVGVPGQDQQGVFLEGVLVDTITTSSQQAITRTYRVNVSDGRLTLLLDDLGGSELHVPIQGLSIVNVSRELMV